ncbi:MAG: hypothetical protein H6Q05_4190 [Acidobacteria bacterium]|nr:hypothetical protein [Acidobacteriota bacterium]
MTLGRLQAGVAPILKFLILGLMDNHENVYFKSHQNVILSL